MAVGKTRGSRGSLVKQSDRSIALLLLEGFSSLALGALLEPLASFAREQADCSVSVDLFALDDRRVRASSGVLVECDLLAEALRRRLMTGTGPDVLIICGPTYSRPAGQERVASLARLARRQGVTLCMIGMANRIVAEAGVLENEPATAHWSLLASFAETCPEVRVQNALYLTGDGVISCAGELATLDMVIALLREWSPRDARSVAERLLLSCHRDGACGQPGSPDQRLLGAPKALACAAQIMSQNIEEPLSVGEIALACGISTRQLERLFRWHTGQTPTRYYESLKLERARELLTQTDLPLAEVALASGLSSASLLNRKCRRLYGRGALRIREAARLSGATRESEEGRSGALAPRLGTQWEAVDGYRLRSA